MTVEASIAIILWLLAVHPFLTYPLSLFVAKKILHKKNNFPCDKENNITSAAICFTVHNEQDVLPSKIANLLELNSTSNIQVRAYVYVDGSTDNSETLLRSASTPINIVSDNVKRGKSHGLNVIINQTSEDIIVFTDANVIFAPDAVDKIAAPFANPNIGCVCGSLCYTNPEETTTSQVGSLYWRFEEQLKELESETGNVMGADGSIFAIRRTLFTPIPTATLPDMFISFETLFKGYRIIRAPDAYAFEKNATDSKDEFRRKIRIACRAFNYHRKYSFKLRSMSIWNQYKYFSHKFLRWLSFLWILMAASMTLMIVLGIGWGLAILGFSACLIWIANTYRIPILSQGSSIIYAMLAAAIGVTESLLGRQYVSWNPAKTAR